jgi:hypothetical protein
MDIKIPKVKAKDFLEQKLGKKVKIIEYKKLGSGFHCVGYKIVYQAGKQRKTVVLRTITPVGFSHDYVSDRANVFVMQQRLSEIVPKHIKSIDVGGLTKYGKLVSLGDCKEFFQIVQEAKGGEYFKDLERIKSTGKLTADDKKRALSLSNYLVQLHKKKFNGSKESAKSIYKRHLRDCIGHGEMLMGVIDTYPDKVSWVNDNQIVKFVSKTIVLWQKLKHKHKRLCRCHGDFHPGNVLFKKGFIVMDASRQEWGDPADDLTCMGINYLWYALMQKGSFKGPFIELFNIYWNNYIKKTKDKELSKIAPLFFAFRGIVVAHPTFYAAQSNKVRKNVFKFINKVLDKKEFNPKKLN